MPVVQPADLGNGDAAALARRLDLTWYRRVPFQREMRARFVVVRKVRPQKPNQMTFVEDDHVIQALSANRTDQAFHVRTLPRRLERDDDSLDTHVLDTLAGFSAVDAAMIADQEAQTEPLQLPCPRSYNAARDSDRGQVRELAMSESSRRDFIGTVGTILAVGAGASLAGPAAAPPATTAPATGRQVIPGSPYPTFSRAIRLDRLVFVAGVVGQKPGTRELVAAEFEPQCRQVLENLKASVEAAGSSLDKVLKCTVYITEATDFAAFNKLYAEYFPKDPPARSSVVVKELVVPGAKLEVDCVTYVA